MTEEGMREVEMALDIRMPPDYRQVISDGDGPANDGFWRDGLFGRPQTVIERTCWLRDMVGDAGASMAPSCVVVSEVNGGDPVVLDTREPRLPLRLWNHETQEFEPFVSSVTEFAHAYRRAAGEASKAG